MPQSQAGKGACNIGTTHRETADEFLKTRPLKITADSADIHVPKWLRSLIFAVAFFALPVAVIIFLFWNRAFGP